MNGMSLRTHSRPLLVCRFSCREPVASGGRAVAAPQQLEGRSVSGSGTEDTGRIGIDIERWSTDEELDSLAGALRRGEAGSLLEVLQQQRRRAGVVLLPGVQAHGARVRERTPRTCSSRARSTRRGDVA